MYTTTIKTLFKQCTYYRCGMWRDASWQVPADFAKDSVYTELSVHGDETIIHTVVTKDGKVTRDYADTLSMNVPDFAAIRETIVRFDAVVKNVKETFVPQEVHCERRKSLQEVTA